ncbi:Pso2 DNA cross-link repair protein [Scheffersomyces amazonensis]|uniref:Pso2 DNA cross-link repair protein n=1 Tax=Scheffersomyces amazonensis TaxID=1078765 RepID=UPI00315C6437
MSNFDGYIREFVGIGVDKFNINANIFLLTHCHADHLVGLSAASFKGEVYCTKATKSLLELQNNYKHIIPYLIPVPFNCPIEIYLDNNKIMISLIPAYHCPGACMFLIESNSSSVLVTGDLRISNLWLEGLNSNPLISSYIFGTKKLDNVYLDTTFAYRGEPFIEINSNNDGIQIAIDMIKEYPKNDPQLCFNFLDHVLGFEEAWAHIVHAFDGRLIVSDEIKRIIHTIRMDENITYSELLDKLVNKQTATGPLFKVAQGDKDVFQINIKQCIDFNIVDFTGVFLPIPITYVNNEDLEHIFTTTMGNQIFKYKNRPWILPKGGSELLPSEIKLLFSRHSSYSECRHLIRLLKPKQVFPCVSSRKLWNNGFSMYRLFGDICNTDKLSFTYDVSMFKQFGFPSEAINNRPVSIIDRWNFEDCANELNLVRDYINHKGDKTSILKGQLYRSEGQYIEDKSSLRIARAKDYRLQTLIAGRAESHYRQMIRKHQENFQNKIDMLWKSPSGGAYGIDSDSDESQDYSSLSESEEDSPTTSIELNNMKVDQIATDLIQDPTYWFNINLQSITSKTKGTNI